MKLDFGGIFGSDTDLIDVDDTQVTRSGAGKTQRITGKGTYELRLAEGALELRRSQMTPSSPIAIDLVVITVGSAYRVVAGSANAALDVSVIGRLPSALQHNHDVALTAYGLVTALPDTMQVVLSRGVYRPSPDVLVRRVLRLPASMGGPRPQDWRRWQALPGDNQDGRWRAAFQATLPVSIGTATLNVHVDYVEWTGTELVFVESEKPPEAPATGAPELVLRRGDSTWVADVSSYLPLVAVAAAPGEAGTAGAAQPRVDGATAAGAPLWLRGTERSWISLAAGARAAARVEESRACVIGRADVAGPSTYSIELLPDGTGRIEVVWDADVATVTEIRLYRPSLRVSVRGIAYEGVSLLWPDLPPADDEPPGDAVWLSTAGDTTDPSAVTLATTTDGHWQLLAAAPLVTHYRRLPESWLDTPPAWAANDTGAGHRPSALRALIPFRADETVRLTLRRSAVEVEGGRFDAVAEPGRPSFGLRPDQLGLELSATKVATVYAARHGVAALDELYRATPDSLRAPANPPGVNGEPAPFEATYVSGRYQEKAGPAPADIPGAVALKGSEDPGEETASWQPPRWITLRLNGETLPFELVIEQHADGGIRRWGVSGTLSLAGLPLQAKQLTRDGDTLTLTLQTAGTSKDAIRGEIQLLIAGMAATASASLGTGSLLRIPAHHVVQAEEHDAALLEARRLSWSNGELRAAEISIRRGFAPDDTSLQLPERSIRVSAADPVRVRFTQSGPVHETRSAADGMTTTTLVSDDDRLTALTLTHHFLPTLTLTENVIRTRETNLWTLRFADVVIDRARFRQHGHRLFVACADSGRQPVQKALSAVAGVAVTALTRVFLELGRIDTGSFEVIGGMLGWRAGELFGLNEAVLGAEDNPDFPHVSVVWPALEPVPSGVAAVPSQNDPSLPLLELNGTWQWTGRRHSMTIHCWDAKLPFTTRKADRLDAKLLPVVVHHKLDLFGDGAGRPLIHAFAFHSADISSGSADLSATIYAEGWSPNAVRPHLAGLKRRALKGFVMDLAPPSRLVDDVAAGDSLLLVLRCGPKWEGTDFKIEPAPAGEPPITPPPLAWSAGVGLLNGSAADWQTMRPDATGDGNSPKVRMFGHKPQALGAFLLSTLATSNGGANREWLPCPIREGAELKNVGIAPPAGRIWIIGSNGLELLYTFAAPPEGQDVRAAAKQNLARAGWHREAVLEMYEQSTPVWELLDSPLLNRSVSLVRFTADVKPVAALLPQPKDGSDTAQLAARKSASPALATPLIKRGTLPDTLVVESLPYHTLNVVSGLELTRDVPFELDRGETAPELRGRLAGGADRAGSFVRPAAVQGQDASDTSRPFLPERMTLYPSRLRPGERVRFGVSAWVGEEGQPPADRAVSLTGGSAIELRTGRWEYASMLAPQPLAIVAQHDGVLIREQLSWRAESVAPATGGPPSYDARDRSILIVHAPHATAAHPADPILFWAFLPMSWGKLMPRPQLGITLTSDGADDATQEILLRTEYFAAEDRPGAEERLIATTERRIAISTLLDRVELLPRDVDERATRVLFSVHLPDTGIDWVAAAARLQFRATGFQSEADASLRIDRNAPRAASSLGMVGLLIRTGAGSEQLVAYGPEPAMCWTPIRVDDSANPTIEWRRRVTWTDVRTLEDYPIHRLFYLDAAGVVVDMAEQFSRRSLDEP